MYNQPYKPNAAPYGYPGYPQGTAGMQAGGQFPPMVPSGSTITPYGMAAPPSPSPAAPTMPGQLPIEQSFIENILRLNLGKIATLYMTYENNSEWNAKIFKGRLEAAGRDHIIISDPATGMRYLLLMVNLDYATFDEELQYTYPYASPGPTGR
ncbi:spore germination protein Q [Paenibacillus sp. UNCCL117]|uniref:spore coat protein GerQ n=1 Tax=unclassified Paenibacillus TaxID=185978 RepID=UPI000880DCB6|nr:MULTISPECIES: spore coat protein GerQ [unclassified Paenibacillus]SDE02722.1 spore germination protein Q [Paenibacillus sp. cl123]SFW57270.1 spore germination protein Q [Paenibacillus sp. UNCCL117]